MAVQLGKGMSEVLRGASERDDGQMLSATDERYDELRRSRSARRHIQRGLR